MTLHRLNHALAFVFGGYQDYDKFYRSSLLEDDGGLFIAILEQLTEKGLAESTSEKAVDIPDKQHHTESTTVTQSFHDEGRISVAVAQRNDKAAPVEAVTMPTKNGDHDNNNEDTNNDIGCTSSNEPDAEQTEMVGGYVNAVRLAAAHVQLKCLKDHHYNIFESAFFYGPDGDRGEYILNGVQVVAAYLGMFFLFYFLGNEIRSLLFEDQDVFFKNEDGEDKQYLGILAINSIGLGYLFFILGREIENVVTFQRCMLVLSPFENLNQRIKVHRMWSLANNYCFNVWMGYALFVLNFFFVQTADNMVDAILNSIAVVFIIQIDDVIPPYVKQNDRTVYILSLGYFPVRPKYWFDFENANLHSKLMDLVEAFLSHKDKTRDRVTVRKTGGESVVFRESDVCYFFVNIKNFEIRVFQGRMEKTGGKYLHMFNEVTYKVEGPGAYNFMKNMAEFECVEEEDGPKKLEISKSRQICRPLRDMEQSQHSTKSR